MKTLVLASTSIYRKELLARLGLPFVTAAPNIDETPRPQEAPDQLVRRLAEAKARAVAADYAEALIIGCDQVATLENRIIGKPVNHACAVDQLRMASGKRLDFLSGLCLFNSATTQAQTVLVAFSVVFRNLSEDQIENYLRHEHPYDCAGSFKSEKLGIALCERLEGDDPSALIGLPLITLIRLLEHEGITVI